MLSASVDNMGMPAQNLKTNFIGRHSKQPFRSHMDQMPNHTSLAGASRVTKSSFSQTRAEILRRRAMGSPNTF